MMASPCFVVCPGPAAQGLYCDIGPRGGPQGDSGFDLRFPADAEIPPTSSGYPVILDLDVKVRCLSQGAYTPYLLVSRSSIGKTPLFLANSVGVVDRGFIGTLRVAVHNFSDRPYAVSRGVSLFQLVRADLEPAGAHIVSEDHPAFAAAASVRGAGGFGSTGLGGTGAT